jgi:ABC-type transport system substrate-binding protein
MKKYLALLLAVAMLCMALAGCGNSSGGSSAGTGQFGQDGREIAKDQTYRSVYGAEVETMNYLVTGTTNNLVAGANVIDALVENDQFGKIVACGAKDWKITDNADGTQTWTFYLREDAYWYDKDGNKKDQVTAHDYVASMVYVNDAKNDSSTQYLTAWVVGAQDYYDWTYAVANAVPETHEHVQVGYFDIGSEIPEFVKKANGDICEVDYVTYKMQTATTFCPLMARPSTRSPACWIPSSPLRLRTSSAPLSTTSPWSTSWIRLVLTS